MRGFRDILRTAGTTLGRGGGDSGGIFKGGRRGGETQYVLPRPPLNAFRGVGEPLCAQRSLTHQRQKELAKTRELKSPIVQKQKENVFKINQI